MPSVIQREPAILTTGGTFDKTYLQGKGMREFAFPERSHVHDVLKRMQCETMDVFSMIPMDSLDMTEAHHEAIAACCASRPEEAIVVVHGTDTMTTSAMYIARLKLEKVIILTGASLPACMRESDADANLAGAICAAKLLPHHGVYIHMHGETYVWDECEKTESGRFEPSSKE